LRLEGKSIVRRDGSCDVCTRQRDAAVGIYDDDAMNVRFQDFLKTMMIVTNTLVIP
jgi:hypothetical protein